jgi:hypothetical protein
MAQHRRRCGNVQFFKTGPDLQLEFPDGGRVVYDWTVVHASAPSFATTSVEAAIERKRKDKTERYGAQAAASNMAFVVLAVTSHGALAKETREFVNRIAPFLQMTPAALENFFFFFFCCHLATLVPGFLRWSPPPSISVPFVIPSSFHLWQRRG